MAKKLITVTALLLLLTSCSNMITDFGCSPFFLKRNKNREGGTLELTLVSQKDTVRSTDYLYEGYMYATLKNPIEKPYFFEWTPAVSLIDDPSPRTIRITIYHNGEESRQLMMDGKQARNPNYFLKKTKPLSLYISPMIQYLKTDKSPGWDNRDYGEYEFQAVYVTTENDTIYSNTVTIHYLE